MEEIRRAQQKGLKVYGETCPQYLVLTGKDLEGLNMEGAKYVCSPPPRDRASQDAIWRGLIGGVFQTFSSDHCPFRFDDEAGKMIPQGRTSFRWVPNGIPGVAARRHRSAGGRGSRNPSARWRRWFRRRRRRDPSVTRRAGGHRRDR